MRRWDLIVSKEVESFDNDFNQSSFPWAGVVHTLVPAKLLLANTVCRAERKGTTLFLCVLLSQLVIISILDNLPSSKGR